MPPATFLLQEVLEIEDEEMVALSDNTITYLGRDWEAYRTVVNCTSATVRLPFSAIPITSIV